MRQASKMLKQNHISNHKLSTMQSTSAIDLANRHGMIKIKKELENQTKQLRDSNASICVEVQDQSE